VLDAAGLIAAPPAGSFADKGGDVRSEGGGEVGGFAEEMAVEVEGRKGFREGIRWGRHGEACGVKYVTTCEWR
jgi:hypothetical protein